MNPVSKEIYSRQGEDVLVLGMLEEMAISTGFYVDLGASDGIKGSNTLAFACRNWFGVAIEADEALHQRLVANMACYHRVGVVHKRVTCEKGNTLDELLVQVKCPHAFDLLSIDIDGNDYWVWKNLSYEPKIVVIEYNCHFENTESKAMPYSADHTWDGDSHYGASAKAMCDLAAKKGYVLVYCVSPSNLIFVKQKYAGLYPNRHKLASIEKVKLFKPSGKWMITPQ